MNPLHNTIRRLPSLVEESFIHQMIEVALHLSLNRDGEVNDKKTIESVRSVLASYESKVIEFHKEIEKEAKFLQEKGL